MPNYTIGTSSPGWVSFQLHFGDKGVITITREGKLKFNPPDMEVEDAAKVFFEYLSNMGCTCAIENKQLKDRVRELSDALVVLHSMHSHGVIFNQLLNDTVDRKFHELFGGEFTGEWHERDS